MIVEKTNLVASVLDPLGLIVLAPVGRNGRKINFGDPGFGLVARRKDALKGDDEIQSQIRLAIVMRLAASANAGRRHLNARGGARVNRCSAAADGTKTGPARVIRRTGTARGGQRVRMQGHLGRDQ